MTATHAAAVRRVIAHISKARNIARFEQNDGRQNLTDTGDGVKKPVAGLAAAVRCQRGFERVDLNLQCLHHRRSVVLYCGIASPGLSPLDLAPALVA